MAETYCTQCGAKNPQGARFCNSCGSALPVASENQVAAQAGETKGRTDFISLTCPKCGGRLEITPDIERFACQHCGVEHLVKRQGGMVLLAPVVEGIKRVESKFDSILTGSEKVAAEQTIQRLKGEITTIENQVKEKEAYITSQKPSIRRFIGGLVYVLIAVAILPAFIKFIPTIKGYDLLPWLLLSIPIGFFFTGIGMMKEHASKTLAQKKVKKVQAELVELRAGLEQRKKQLDDLHQFTIQH